MNLLIAIRFAGSKFRNKLVGQDATKTVVILAIFCFLLIMIGGPLILYVWGSVWTELPFLGGRFTLSGYRSLFDQRIYSTIRNTIVFSVFGLLFSFILSIIFLFYSLKLNSRGRLLIPAILIAQFLLPGYLLAVAWEVYAGPHGLVNQILMALPFIDDPILNVRSVIGMAFVAGTNFAGLIFLLVSGAIVASTRDIEEAAVMSGASPLDIFRRISIPLAIPSFSIAFVLVFTSLVQNFSIPLVLGLPERTFVIATHIYIAARSWPPDFAFAFALGMPILILAFLGLLIQQRLTGSRGKYETVGEEDTDVYLYDVKYQKVISIFVWGIIVFAYILPLMVLFLSSFQAGYTFDPLATNYTLANWETILVGNLAEQFFIAWRNTIIVGIIGGIFAMLITGVTSYIITKTDTVLSRATDYLTLAPAGIPGIVLAVTFLRIVLELGIMQYNSLIFVIIASSIPGIVYASRATNSSYRAIGSQLEEAGKLAGANFYKIIQKIYLPLISPGLVAGFVLVFIFYLKVLTIPVMLITSSDETMIQAFLYNQLLAGHIGEVAAITSTIIIGIGLIFLLVHYFTDVDLTRI